MPSRSRGLRFTVVLIAPMSFTAVSGAQGLDVPSIDPVVVSSDNLSVQLQTYGAALPALPTDFTVDGTGRAFVTLQDNRIYTMTPDGTTTLYLDDRNSNTIDGIQGSPNNPLPQRNLDIGMTSIALHPDFATNGKFYTVQAVSKGLNAGNDSMFQPDFGGFGFDGNEFTRGHHQSVVFEYTVDPTAISLSSVAAVASRREVLSMHQRHHSHNIGDLAFGADGLLYITAGDGGNGLGHERNANDSDSPYGSLLRIDPTDLVGGAGKTVYSYDGQARFSVVDDPGAFVMTDNDGTDVALGVTTGGRNNYRISFDVDGNLWVSNTGQKHSESVYRYEQGADYGWGLVEGSLIYTRDGGDQTVVPTRLLDVVAEINSTGFDGQVDVATVFDSSTNLAYEAVYGTGDTAQRQALGTRILSDAEEQRALALIAGGNLPVFEYDHSDGVSSIGGTRYDGQRFSELDGMLIFGDLQGTGDRLDDEGRTLGTGARLFYGDPDATDAEIRELLIDPNGEAMLDRLLGVGRGLDNELYIYGLYFTDTGVEYRVLQLVPEPSGLAMLVVLGVMVRPRRRTLQGSGPIEHGIDQGLRIQ